MPVVAAELPAHLAPWEVGGVDVDVGHAGADGGDDLLDLAGADELAGRADDVVGGGFALERGGPGRAGLGAGGSVAEIAAEEDADMPPLVWRWPKWTWASFTVVSQLKLADEIRSLAWWEAGARLLAVHKRADAVSLVDSAVPQVTSTVVLDGDPDRAAVAQGTGTGYVGTHGDASVNRVDLAAPSLLGRYAIASRVSALVFDPVAYGMTPIA